MKKLLLVALVLLSVSACKEEKKTELKPVTQEEYLGMSNKEQKRYNAKYGLGSAEKPDAEAQKALDDLGI